MVWFWVDAYAPVSFITVADDKYAIENDWKLDVGMYYMLAVFKIFNTMLLLN